MFEDCARTSVAITARKSPYPASYAIDGGAFRIWYTSTVRHETMPRAEARPITNRRLQAARRALARERDACPLFADDIADEQPTPEERVRILDAEHVAWWQRIRDYNAQTWRAARRILNSLPAADRDRLYAEWQSAPYPGSASYFADFLYQRVGRSVSREQADGNQ